jgi:hypothetical protein
MIELFHFDIETAANYKDFKTFESNDERGSKLFKDKFNRLGWETKYDSVEFRDLTAGIISTYGRIVCISCGYIDNEGNNKVSSFYGDDEKKL